MNRWFLAIRPKTLLLGAGPVLMGAFVSGISNFWAFLCCLVLSLSAQIGANLSNDYFDALYGVDTAARKGFLRVTQAGLISHQEMRQAICFSFAVTLVSGLFLGGPFVIVSALAVLFALWYSWGKRLSLSHLALGELVAFIFFGPVAVLGTSYAMHGTWTAPLLWASCGFGALAAAVMAVNNVRDVHTDAQAKKMTLAVLCGAAFGRGFITVLLLLSLLCALQVSLWTLLPMFLLIPLMIRVLFSLQREAELNQTLAMLARVAFLYALSLGLVCYGVGSPHNAENTHSVAEREISQKSAR